MRFLATLSTVLAADISTVWIRLNGSWENVAPSTYEPEEGIIPWLRYLGVSCDLLDITGGGSKLIAISRLCSVILTTIVSFDLLISNNYPIVQSNYGFPFHVKGIKRFTTFTCWCWSLITIYFFTVSYFTLYGGLTKSIFIPILFEVCLVTAVLVTLVVYFILIPVARKKDKYRLKRLLEMRALLLHNANVVMMLTEFYLSGFRVRKSNWVVGLAYCNMYILFAWIWGALTGVYYYFFLDYTKHIWAPLAYLALFFTLYGIWILCVNFGHGIDHYYI